MGKSLNPIKSFST